MGVTKASTSSSEEKLGGLWCIKALEGPRVLADRAVTSRSAPLRVESRHCLLASVLQGFHHRAEGSEPPARLGALCAQSSEAADAGRSRRRAVGEVQLQVP